MERATKAEISGCGTSHSTDITLNIQTTTGGNFSISVNGKVTVEHLKKVVSKKLKVSKDRICLLHRDRQLRDGTLEENGVVDGSRIILLPSVETGLLAQRPENSVMQALESLNDTQVNDFLSGKSPLNLTMRLGDHMMLIQLQLSTLSAGGTRPSRSSHHKHNTASSSNTTVTNSVKSVVTPQKNNAASTGETTDSAEKAAAKCFEELEKDKTPEKAVKDENLKSFLREQDIETLQNAFEIFKSLAEIQDDLDDPSSPDSEKCISKTENQSYSEESVPSSADASFEEQSPIKSLSNLVSSPLKTVVQQDEPMSEAKDDETEKDKASCTVPLPKYVPFPSSIKNNLLDSLKINTSPEENGDCLTESPIITDPIAANLTSCLCSTLDSRYTCDCLCPSPRKFDSPVKDNSSSEDNVEMATDQSSFLMESPLDEYPMENLFNNALDQGLFKNSEEVVIDSEISNLATTSLTYDRPQAIVNVDSCKSVSSEPLPSFQSVSDTNKKKRLHILLHKTSKFKHPIAQNKQKAFMQSVVNKHIKKTMQQRSSTTNSDANPQPSTSKIMPSYMPTRKLTLLGSPAQSGNTSTDKAKYISTKIEPKIAVQPVSPTSTTTTVTDTKALIEASKNLTQTLKKLSKEVLTSKVDLNGDDSPRTKIGQGAVIESMKHHGKGIYSGTFSGTLNPALQDRYGRPKRDISTIIHILNDLLCNAPIPVQKDNGRLSTPEKGSHRSDCVCRSGRSGCVYGQCDGHMARTQPSKPCKCQSAMKTDAPSIEETCETCASKTEDKTNLCKNCLDANNLAIENSKTKCKIDQLRLVMQQKKQRREARKSKIVPYTTIPPPKMISPTEKSPIISEEIDTVA